MSTTENENKRGEKLSEWAETLDHTSANVIVVRGNGKDSGRALLEAALGSADAVDKAIGRPNLSGVTGRGESQESNAC